jgi:uncharacterized membrane protein (UPF0182 family)
MEVISMCGNYVVGCDWKYNVRDLKFYIYTLMMMMMMMMTTMMIMMMMMMMMTTTTKTILIGTCEISGLHFGDSEA